MNNQPLVVFATTTIAGQDPHVFVFRFPNDTDALTFRDTIMRRCHESLPGGSIPSIQFVKRLWIDWFDKVNKNK